MKTKFIQICIFVFIIVGSLNIIIPVLKNIHLYTEKFNLKKYEQKYNKSQYIIPQSKNPISDEELLSFAGYKYATGLNPILINSDHPPLGKYFIGWITLLTGNQRMSSIFFAIGIIILISLSIYSITQSWLMTSLGFFFLSLDSMFIDQIIHAPILDIIQVFFLLLYLLLLQKWIKRESMCTLFFMGIALGCMSSIKLYFPIFVVLASTFVSLLIIKKSTKKIIFVLFIIFLLTFSVYLLSYASFFIQGYSIRQFFGTQKWIFLFWKNNSVQSSKFIGDALTLILFNQWKVWWGTQPYIQFERWTFLWPIFFLSGIISSIYVLWLKLKLKIFVSSNAIVIPYAVWILFATIYLSFLPISPRYILILFFPIYIVIPVVIQLITNLKIKDQNSKLSIINNKK